MAYLLLPEDSFKIRNLNKTFLWIWIVHLSRAYYLLLGIRQDSHCPSPNHCTHCGSMWKPEGPILWVWTWSPFDVAPTVLKTLGEWYSGETNLPAMQLPVKLAHGIAYGVTRWLISQTREEAKKKFFKRKDFRKDASLIEKATAQHIIFSQ